MHLTQDEPANAPVPCNRLTRAFNLFHSALKRWRAHTSRGFQWEVRPNAIPSGLQLALMAACPRAQPGKGRHDEVKNASFIRPFEGMLGKDFPFQRQELIPHVPHEVSRAPGNPIKEGTPSPGSPRYP